LLIALLKEMGDALGFDFDKVQLRRGGYMPQGLINVEEEQHLIRRQFARVLSGEIAIPMRVTDFPLVVDDESTRHAVREVLPEILKKIEAGEVKPLAIRSEQKASAAVD